MISKKHFFAALCIALPCLLLANCAEQSTVLSTDTTIYNDSPTIDTNSGDTPPSLDQSAPTDTNTPKPFPDSPADLLDMNVISNVASLDLAWNQNLSGPEPGGNGLVYRLTFSFTSQTYHGEEWRHQATLYLPTQQSRGSGDLLAVIQQGQLPIGGDPTTVFKNSFGIYVVRDMNIPILMVEDVIPEGLTLVGNNQTEVFNLYPHCFDAPLDEDTFLNCALGLVHTTGNAGYCPFSASARVLMRAVTAAREVVTLASNVRAEVPMSSLNPPTIVYGGEGIAGFGARQALAVDPRAEGALSVGADMGNITEFNALQAAVWPEGPYWINTAVLAELSSTAKGLGYLKTFDIKSYASLLEGKHLAMAVGTNDPRFPVGSLELFADSVFAEIIPLYLRNESEGWVDQSVASLWRVLLNRVLHDLEPPRVLSQLTELGGNTIIQANVSGCKAINGLQCNAIQGWVASIQAQGNDPDYRDVTWTPLSLTLKQSIGATSTYEGLVDTSVLPSNSAVFIQITDIRDTWSAFVTSRLVFVGQPYPFP